MKEQTYDKLKIIFVDDASIDNSYDILCTYADQDEKLMKDAIRTNADIICSGIKDIKPNKNKFEVLRKIQYNGEIVIIIQ